MKQYNIFGNIDYLNDEGEIKRCCMCNTSIEKGQLCESQKCADEWWEKYIINGIK